MALVFNGNPLLGAINCSFNDSNPNLNTYITTVTGLGGSVSTTYGIKSSSSGLDTSLVTVHPDNGTVSFLSNPEYMNPLDSDKNNIYSVVVWCVDPPDSGNLLINVSVVTDQINTFRIRRSTPLSKSVITLFNNRPTGIVSNRVGTINDITNIDNRYQDTFHYYIPPTGTTP